jgi:hypothetical protein
MAICAPMAAQHGKPMDETPADWRRVAAAIEARRAQIPLSKTELYERSMSEGTFRKMASGVGVARSENRTLIARALGWTDDSIDRLLRREAPVAATTPVSSETADLRRLVEAIQRTVEVEQAEAHRHGLAIERLADELQQLLDVMPSQDGAAQPPSNAAH